MTHIPAVERYVTKNYASEKGLTAGESLLGAYLCGEWAQDRHLIKAEDFFLDHEKRLYVAMEQIAATGAIPDLMLLANSMRKDAYWTIEKLITLTEGAPVAQNLAEYARRVKAAKTAVQIIESTVTLVRALDVMEEPAEALKRHLVEMNALACGSPTGQDRIVDLSDALYEAIADLEARMQGTAVSRILTGWDPLDRDLPFSKQDLVILAGRPGMGKTSMTLNLIDAMMRRTDDIVGLVISLEMSTDQLLFKMLGAVAAVESNKFRNPTDMDSQDLDQVIAAARSLHEIAGRRLSFSERRRMKVEDIPIEIARMKAIKGRCDFVVIDYLGMLGTSGKSKDQYHKITAISGALKQIARSENVLVLCLAQLNRAAGREKRKPEMTDIRDSGAIEQDADAVLFVHHDGYYEEVKATNYGTTSTEPLDDRTFLCVRKNRHGEQQRFDIPFRYEKSIGRVRPLGDGEY
jgi:replicative DNA helicase